MPAFQLTRSRDSGFRNAAFQAAGVAVAFAFAFDLALLHVSRALFDKTKVPANPTSADKNHTTSTATSIPDSGIIHFRDASSTSLRAKCGDPREGWARLSICDIGSAFHSGSVFSQLDCIAPDLAL
jgi:hypothetical protein